MKERSTHIKRHCIGCDRDRPLRCFRGKADRCIDCTIAGRVSPDIYPLDDPTILRIHQRRRAVGYSLNSCAINVGINSTVLAHALAGRAIKPETREAISDWLGKQRTLALYGRNAEAAIR